jgi:hypothetical protein
MSRCLAGELSKIVNHVHLVVVPELVGHVRPGFRRKARLAIERCFEPRNPGKEFGPHPHLLTC